MVPFIAAIPWIIRLALAGFGFTSAVWGVSKMTEIGEKKLFNKGVCPKCGGHFKYIEGTEVKGSKAYKCDFCNDCVLVSYGADIGYEYKPSKLSKKT